MIISKELNLKEAIKKGTQGFIYSIQLCPGHRRDMKEVKYVEAVENFGLVGDRHAITDSSRQVFLIELETLEELGLKPGQVKENIATKGIFLMQLLPTQQLKIGRQVIIEITKPCTPCNRMDEIRQGLVQEIAGRRGMLAGVVRGGQIRRGDQINILQT